MIQPTSFQGIPVFVSEWIEKDAVWFMPTNLYPQRIFIGTDVDARMLAEKMNEIRALLAQREPQN